MPVDYVKIHVEFPAKYSGEFLAIVNDTRSLIDRVDKLTTVLGHNFDSSALDFTIVEQMLGVDTGNGNLAYDYLNGMLGALNGTMQNNNAISLISRFGP